MRVNELFEDSHGLEALLQSKAPKNLAAMIAGHAPVLYRGMDVYDRTPIGSTREFNGYHISPRTKRRNSKTGLNLMMNYVDTSPAWELFPKRGLSMSVTADYEHTFTFSGNVGIVIPFDEVGNFGCTPTDFNYKTVDGMRLPQRMREVRTLVVDSRRIFKMLTPDRMQYFTSPQVDCAYETLRLLSALDIFDEKYSASDEAQLNPNYIETLSDLITAMIKGFENPVIIAGCEADGKAVPSAIEWIREQLDTCRDFAKSYSPSLKDWFDQHLSPAAFNAEVYRKIWMLPDSEDRANEIWFTGDAILLTPTSAERTLRSPADARRALATLQTKKAADESN